jgi:hopene-associated glycosyltransferase HpnB
LDGVRVHVIVPARNEAAVLAQTLPSVLGQRYAGPLRVTLADDHSDDSTAARAHWLATECGAAKFFSVATVPPRPAGWAGKVWALAAGVAAARASGAAPDFWLFTDADIVHDPDIVAALVATARADARDLVSLMVTLRCQTRWERLLIPAFVFFFAKLYPFAWVADDRRRTAAAAGGCVLIADRMLRRIGGVERIAAALIDDCALAAAVKSDGGRLRLELTSKSRSVRAYDSLDAVWQMVARSAYTQLKTSPPLLAGTVGGMLMLYAVPPAALAAGIVRRDRMLALGGALAWSIMSTMYVPMVRRYGLPRRAAIALPVAAGLYTLMTIDSAVRHWRGRGGAWKGRVQSGSATVDELPPTSRNGHISISQTP